MSLYLALQFNNIGLSSATGFVVEHQGMHYLITNWHVISGRNNQTGQPLDTQHGAVPNILTIFHNVHNHLGAWIPVREPLYDSGNDPSSDQPRWLEHPVYGRAVDVVALPLTDLNNVGTYPYDPWTPPTLAVGPSDMVSVPGFPFGQRAGGLLAIWVQGAMASEPDVDIDYLPLFLIDSRTKPGSSGSPVIAYRTGGAVTTAGGGTAIFSGSIWSFLGVYSGRIEDGSDVGRVWKASVISDIITGQTHGTV